MFQKYFFIIFLKIYFNEIFILKIKSNYNNDISIIFQIKKNLMKLQIILFS